MSAGAQAADWLLEPALAPVVDGDLLAPLYAGAARGELVLPACGGCGLPLDLEQLVCDGCGQREIVWRAVALAGVVHSATTMHRFEPGLVRASEPYPIVDVELRSGHRLIMTTLEHQRVPPDIGEPVAIAFRYLGGIAVPAAQSNPSIDTEAHHDKH
ncbi:Zn-ribbon domain-containing OB-fold protein [Tomitella biformata]|uniref:Zn-ribbon domain-containing OB-fold protein n=1 Tax=Tomitella biformata TaxID=630403 RepID=UPI000466FDB4|nr:OB-fold domain-containing protein [Tomitella biformata]